jgi:DnaJ domain
MGFHSFSVDPRTILGVSPAASVDEIHEAYRSKSKKHHPDMGGDEWAFRMVVRAYEVLTTTTAITASEPWKPPGTQANSSSHGTGWTWVGTPSAGQSNGNFESQQTSARANQGEDPYFDTHKNAEPHANDAEPTSSGVNPEEFRVVDVELIWTRFEEDGAIRQRSPWEETEATLSVCLVISWPAAHLVARAAEFGSTREILHVLIDLFESLHSSASVIAGRSRIEDGRFVGWLSYPNVLAAQDAFLSLRDTLQAQGLTVKLQTVDERVPFAWHCASQEPIMKSAG